MASGSRLGRVWISDTSGSWPKRFDDRLSKRGTGLAGGCYTDMRRGMPDLALQLQEALRRDPHAGDLYVFCGPRGDLINIFWHDGIGMSLYPKRLERGKFIWRTPRDGVVAVTAAQLSYMLGRIDWRNPRWTWRRTRPADNDYISLTDPTRAVVIRSHHGYGSRRCAEGDRSGDACARVTAEAEVARERALNTNAEALIAHLKLEIEKLRRELYGSRSERKARLLNQLELQLEELEADATEDELAAEQAAARSRTQVGSFEHRRPVRKPFPEHVPRERIVIAAPERCPCCGSHRLSKLGKDITETPEVIRSSRANGR